MSFGMRLVAMARRVTATATATASPWGFHRYSSSATGPMHPRFGRIGSDGLPVSVDWRKQGAVTPVSSQGNCGSCWAFATTASMEGINAIMSNHLVKLSEQQLLDCVTCSCKGCGGGGVIPAFRYLYRNGGQVSYDVYPYIAKENIVHKRVIAPAVSIDGFAYSFHGTEKDLKVAVASQPVVVALGADKAFVEYDDGVVDGKNYTFAEMGTIKFMDSYIGHYVTVVGYGVTKFGELFWLVKNSHGTSYGEDGYIRIARETGKEGGAFGIARFFAYPVKNSGQNNGRCKVMSEAELKGCHHIFWTR